MKPYGSLTLEMITKHLVAEMPESGEIDLPFHLENFCKEMDEMINNLKQLAASTDSSEPN